MGSAVLEERVRQARCFMLDQGPLYVEPDLVAITLYS